MILFRNIRRVPPLHYTAAAGDVNGAGAPSVYYGDEIGMKGDNDLRTLPIAIAGFFGQHQFTQWGYVFAMSVLTLIPVVIIFILCQKFFVQGLTAGSVKG